MKKKITLILTDTPIAQGGGLGERYKYLIPALEEHYELEAFAGSQGGVFSKTRFNQLYTGSIAENNLLSNFLWTEMAWTEQLLDYYSKPENRRPDYVLSTDFTAMMPGKALANACNAKFIIDFNLANYSFTKTFDVAQLSPDNKSYWNAIMKFEGLATISADLVLTCSDFYKKDLPKEWRTKREVVSVPNAIVHEQWKKEVPTYEFKGGFQHNFVYIGRMSTQKGVNLMADYKLRHTGGNKAPEMLVVPKESLLVLPENSGLFFVGGPNGGDQYEAIVKTTEGSRTKLAIPFVKGDDKLSLMKSATAIIMPSTHEPHGIVGLEAMAAGVPLITSAVDGIGDYANESNSIICDLSPSGIKDAMLRVINMKAEDKMAMLEKAKAKAHEWTWEQAKNLMVKSILELG